MDFDERFLIARNKQSHVKAFSHTPCWTYDEAVYRLFAIEIPIIKKMQAEGQPIRSIFAYHSKTTGECHAMPIFDKDNVLDALNRYMDLFPLEVSQFQKDVHELKGTPQEKLSNMRVQMSMAKFPLGLYRLMLCFDENFWHDDRNIKLIMKLVPKLVCMTK